jgi:ABC-type dipeptide/oligopeptide/nickel transport system ATPase component
MDESKAPLLELRNLTTVFPTKRGLVTAASGVNLRLAPGEILSIVGESGCGKSTVLLSVLGLIPQPGRIASGEVIFRGQDLRQLPGRSMRAIRGKEIAMIFQDPLSTLNPVFTVGEQIHEAMRLHDIMNQGALALPWPLGGVRRNREEQRVLEVMEEVGISFW